MSPIKKHHQKAQATIEFTFGMIVAVLLLMGMVQVLIWVGKDLSKRRKAHEDTLQRDQHGLIQTRPTFYFSTPISSTVRSDVFGEPF